MRMPRRSPSTSPAVKLPGALSRRDEDGRTHLIIGLGELNDSGHTGIAWLGDDGEETEIVV